MMISPEPAYLPSSSPMFSRVTRSLTKWAPFCLTKRALSSTSAKSITVKLLVGISRCLNSSGRAQRETAPSPMTRIFPSNFIHALPTDAPEKNRPVKIVGDQGCVEQVLQRRRWGFLTCSRRVRGRIFAVISDRARNEEHVRKPQVFVARLVQRNPSASIPVNGHGCQDDHGKNHAGFAC